MADEALLQATYEARDKFVKGLGVANPDVLAPLINPSFMGGPMWPDLRQAWRVVRRGPNTIVVSDGLSDPFSDEPEPNPGFGLEVLAETGDPMPEQMQASWLFDLVYQVSQQCASHGGVRDLIEKLGLLAARIADVGGSAARRNVKQPGGRPPGFGTARHAVRVSFARWFRQGRDREVVVALRIGLRGVKRQSRPRRFGQAVCR